MEFRTVVIQSACKLSYKDGFLIIRGDETKTVHLSEIHTLIVDSTMTTITGYLLCEMMKNKINVIFCDEQRNPVGLLNPCYGSHDSAGRALEQAKWHDDDKDVLWQSIIRQKIRNQGRLLATEDEKTANQILQFAEQVTPGDVTNREGHAAKVYFNRIFGPEFSRSIKSDRNAALNYGYSLLLSVFNKEITARGYLTQLGIHHRNAGNQFNLSSDLMEPFRFLIDRVVKQQQDAEFDKEYKYKLLNVLQTEVTYGKQNMYLTTAITRYVRNATDFLGGRISWTDDMVMRYEDAAYESDPDV